MNEILQFTTTGAALVALIFAFLSWILSRGVERSLETVKHDSNQVREQLSDVKAQVQHTDMEYIKKILLRVTDNEQSQKKLANDIDLLDEKLKSFMNRINARSYKPKLEPEPKEEPDNQEDILSQLKATGNAIPLSPDAEASQPTRFVRASALRRRKTG